jgi:hypothetical protein
VQRRQQKAEDHQQQRQVKDFAHAVEDAPDQYEESPKSGSEGHLNAQIFSSIRAALPDKSRR